MKMKCLTSRKSILALLVVFAVGTGITQAQETNETLNLSLNQALEIALSENPTILIAGKEIELKKEIRREAYGNLLPEVSAVASYQRTLKKQTMVMDIGETAEKFKVGRDNTYNGGFSISLPIFAPALYKAISLTETDIELAVEQSRASELDLINEVTKSFYQLLLAQDSYDVLLKSYNQAQANYEIVVARFEQGLVSEYDKIRADVQVRNIYPTVISARNGVRLAGLHLKVLMGLDTERDLAVQGNLKDYEMVMFQTQIGEQDLNLYGNTNLRQLELNAELLRKNLKLQQTNFKPTLGASFNYTYMSMNDDFRIAHYEWYPYSTIGISLTIPLYKASNFSKVKQTRIQMTQLELNKINVERQLRMQADSYRDNMAVSTEQVISNQENILQAEKGRQIAQRRYEVGMGTILELNDSEVALTEAQLVYNQSIYDYLIAKTELDNILGKER